VTTGTPELPPPAPPHPVRPTGFARFAADVRGLIHLVGEAGKLVKWAAGAGATLAVICHLLPPHYRVPCDALAHLCKLSGR